MSRAKRFFDRWKNDYDFKTVAAAFGSLVVTAVFALCNGFLGMYQASLWHGSICAYYIVLVVLRTIIIAAGSRSDGKDGRERGHEKIYLVSAALFFIPEYLPRCSRVPDGRSAKARPYDVDPRNRDGSVYDV